MAIAPAEPLCRAYGVFGASGESRPRGSGKEGMAGPQLDPLGHRTVPTNS